MSISLSNDITSVAKSLNARNDKDAKATALQSKLSNLDSASDEELMEACKSFESYLVEQVMNKVKDAMVPEREDEDGHEYLDMFEENLYRSYADTITQSGELGIAQHLYEAMKRDYGKQVKISDASDDAKAAAASSAVSEKENE